MTIYICKLIFPTQNIGYRSEISLEVHIILSATITRTHKKLVCLCESYAVCPSNTRSRLGAINSINAAVQ